MPAKISINPNMALFTLSVLSMLQVIITPSKIKTYHSCIVFTTIKYEYLSIINTAIYLICYIEITLLPCISLFKFLKDEGSI